MIEVVEKCGRLRFFSIVEFVVESGVVVVRVVIAVLRRS